jgi:cation diffusion facilitator CzcD-associated flavoprotein CzcO
MSSTKTYDLCIIGSGPGGLTAAVALRSSDVVLIVEKDSRLGGVCTLRLHSDEALLRGRSSRGGGTDPTWALRRRRCGSTAGALKHKEKVVRQTRTGSAT